MTPLISDDGLAVTQEGSGVRARSGKLSYLFRSRIADDVFKEYLEKVERAREFYRPKQSELAPDDLTETEFIELAKATALHCIYFKVAVETQVISCTEFFFSNKFGKSSPRAIRCAAAMASVSIQKMEKYIQDLKRFYDMW